MSTSASTPKLTNPYLTKTDFGRGLTPAGNTNKNGGGGGGGGVILMNNNGGNNSLHTDTNSNAVGTLIMQHNSHIISTANIISANNTISSSSSGSSQSNTNLNHQHNQVPSASAPAAATTNNTSNKKLMSSSANNLVNQHYHHQQHYPFQSQNLITIPPTSQINNNSAFLMGSSGQQTMNINQNPYTTTTNMSNSKQTMPNGVVEQQSAMTGTTTTSTYALRQRILQLEKENRQLMSNQGSLIIETNKRIQTQVNEYRLLREENGKLSGENAELRDLCCYLDDDRQKTKRSCKEWQRFGRYTAGVMKSEVEAYRAKLSELELRQEHLVAENAEMKQLCLFLDEQRNKVYKCSNCGTQMSLSDTNNDTKLLAALEDDNSNNAGSDNNPRRLQNDTTTVFTKNAINKLLMSKHEHHTTNYRELPTAAVNDQLSTSKRPPPPSPPIRTTPPQSILKNNTDNDNNGKAAGILTAFDHHSMETMDINSNGVPDTPHAVHEPNRGGSNRRNLTFCEAIDRPPKTNGPGGSRSSEDSYSPGNSDTSDCPTFSSSSSSGSGSTNNSNSNSSEDNHSFASSGASDDQGSENQIQNVTSLESDAPSSPPCLATANSPTQRRQGESSAEYDTSQHATNNQTTSHQQKFLTTDTKVLEYIEQLERRVEQLEENRISQQQEQQKQQQQDSNVQAISQTLVHSTTLTNSSDGSFSEDKITIRLREGGGNPLITSTDSAQSVGTSTIYGSEDDDNGGALHGMITSNTAIEDEEEEEYPDEFVLGGDDECERITEDEGFAPSEDSPSPANSTLTPIEEEVSDDFDDSDNEGSTNRRQQRRQDDSDATEDSSSDDGRMIRPSAPSKLVRSPRSMELSSHLSRSVPVNLDGELSSTSKDGGNAGTTSTSTWGPLYRTSSEKLDNAQNREEDTWTTSIASQGKTLSEALKVLEIQEQQEEMRMNVTEKAILNQMCKVVWKTLDENHTVTERSASSNQHRHLSDKEMSRTFL